jgi:hypothetical protein
MSIISLTMVPSQGYETKHSTSTTPTNGHTVRFPRRCALTHTTVLAIDTIPLYQGVKWLSAIIVVNNAPPFRDTSKARLYSCPHLTLKNSTKCKGPHWNSSRLTGWMSSCATQLTSTEIRSRTLPGRQGRIDTGNKEKPETISLGTQVSSLVD